MEDLEHRIAQARRFGHFFNGPYTEAPIQCLRNPKKTTTNKTVSVPKVAASKKIRKRTRPPKKAPLPKALRISKKKTAQASYAPLVGTKTLRNRVRVNYGPMMKSSSGGGGHGAKGRANDDNPLSFIRDPSQATNPVSLGGTPIAFSTGTLSKKSGYEAMDISGTDYTQSNIPGPKQYWRPGTPTSLGVLAPIGQMANSWKTGLDRVKVKGQRDLSGKTEGLIPKEITAPRKPWDFDQPGASKERKSLPHEDGSEYSHLFRHLWGGPETRKNAPPTSGHQNTEQLALEDSVQEAITKAKVDPDNLRLKFTAYVRPSTDPNPQTAKHMRMKVYSRADPTKPFTKVIDHLSSGDRGPIEKSEVELLQSQAKGFVSGTTPATIWPKTPKGVSTDPMYSGVDPTIHKPVYQGTGKKRKVSWRGFTP